MPIPDMNLVINVSGFAEGYEPFVTIMKHEDYSVLQTTNAVSFTYTMPDFDIDVVADATPPSYNDPEGRAIEDPVIIGWLAGNGVAQADIEGDSIFDTAPAEGTVTQSVTATFSPFDVTAKFFRAVIEFPSSWDPEEPWEDPESDPEE